MNFKEEKIQCRPQKFEKLEDFKKLVNIVI